jgi:hypothetical protein
MLFQYQAGLGRELEDRGACVQRRGEVNDLDPAGEELRCELGKVGHGDPFWRLTLRPYLGRRPSVKRREGLTLVISRIYHSDIRLRKLRCAVPSVAYPP